MLNPSPPPNGIFFLVDLTFLVSSKQGQYTYHPTHPALAWSVMGDKRVHVSTVLCTSTKGYDKQHLYMKAYMTEVLHMDMTDTGTETTESTDDNEHKTNSNLKRNRKSKDSDANGNFLTII